jgi:hypothetical protein
MQAIKSKTKKKHIIMQPKDHIRDDKFFIRYADKEAEHPLTPAQIDLLYNPAWYRAELEKPPVRGLLWIVGCATCGKRYAAYGADVRRGVVAFCACPKKPRGRSSQTPREPQPAHPPKPRPLSNPEGIKPGMTFGHQDFPETPKKLTVLREHADLPGVWWCKCQGCGNKAAFLASDLIERRALYCGEPQHHGGARTRLLSWQRNHTAHRYDVEHMPRYRTPENILKRAQARKEERERQKLLSITRNPRMNTKAEDWTGVPVGDLRGMWRDWKHPHGDNYGPIWRMECQHKVEDVSKNSFETDGVCGSILYVPSRMLRYTRGVVDCGQHGTPGFKLPTGCTAYARIVEEYGKQVKEADADFWKLTSLRGRNVGLLHVRGPAPLGRHQGKVVVEPDGQDGWECKCACGQSVRVMRREIEMQTVTWCGEERRHAGQGLLSNKGAKNFYDRFIVNS